MAKTSMKRTLQDPSIGPTSEASIVPGPPASDNEHAPRQSDQRTLVAQRAYERFQMRGGTHGHDQEDWLLAEQELNAGQSS